MRVMAAAGWALSCLWVTAVSSAEALPPVIGSPESTQVSGGAGQPTLESRVARLERKSEHKTMFTLLTRIEQLQQEVPQLRGIVEELDHQFDLLKSRQRSLYLDIDQRLSALERKLEEMLARLEAMSSAQPAGTAQNGVVEPVSPGVAVGLPIPAGTALPSQQVASIDEKNEYRAARELLKQRRFDDAIESFSGLLQKFPEGQYADNAQYWIGEGFYGTEEFRKAIVAFRKVVTTYPTSPKVPDSILKIGFSHYELGQWQPARDTLNDLVARFPDTSASRLARNRLKRMRLEGR